MDATYDAFTKVEKNGYGKELKTEKDLVDFLAKEATIPFKEGGLFYKVFIVENYSKT